MALQTKNDTKTPPHQTIPDLRLASAESMPHLADGSVDLVVTSPPYWNARQYSDYRPGTTSQKRRDYAKGFESYEEYLSLMSRCCSECFRVPNLGVP